MKQHNYIKRKRLDVEKLFYASHIYIKANLYGI